MKPKIQISILEYAQNCATLLGISLPASSETLKSAFREKSKKTHPDHGGNPADFIKVKDAYKFLQTYTHVENKVIWESPFDRNKNYGTCLRCNGTGLVDGWSYYQKLSCPKCNGLGQVELFNPVLAKMRFGQNVSQKERKRREAEMQK